MFGLLRFLSRFGALFLFFLLEGICIYLIVRFNENQSQIYASSASLVSGEVLSRYHHVASYFGLRKQITQLHEDIARLQEENGRSFYYDYAVSDTARLQIDSARLVPLYAFIPAEVVNNSISGKKNMLTINRGAKHGIRPSMGVITSEGVVGIVRHTTPRLASVMSILNTQTRISASVRHKPYFGSLVWRGDDSRFMYLVDVPKHNLVHPGDTIETSGYSSLFPKGILIGIVQKAWVPSGESNYQIKVKLHTDPGGIRQVFVVQNLLHKEFEQLEQNLADE